MSTPDNVFETLPADTLVTATGGVTSSSSDIKPRDLWKLNHLISDTAKTQQATTNQNTTMLLVACLAARRQ